MASFPLLCFATGLLGQSVAPQGNRDSVLKQHYEAAQTFQAAGKFDDAARQYRIFIADALAEIALQTINQNDYSKAAPLFDEALQLAPRSPGLKIRYAQAAFNAHDLSRTRTLAESILRDYPENKQAVAKAHLLLGRVFQKMNHETSAKEQFELAVSLDPNFENGYALAVTYLDLDDGPSAAKVFSEMVAGLGDTPALHMEIGRAYLNSDFQPESIPEFKKVLAKDPQLPGVHYALAVAYLFGSTQDAREAAKIELDAEAEISPQDASTHAQLGNIALQQQNYPVAEQELKKAAALDPADPNPWFYLGQLYSETKKTDEAIAALKQSIALTKNPAQNRYQVQKVHYQLGRLLIQTGQTEQGKLEMQTSSTLLKKSLGKDRDRLSGESDEKALGDYQAKDAVTQAPDPKATEMVAEFEKKLSPAIADSYNNLGVIAAGNGDSINAITSFERAYEWNPSLEGLNENWGLAAFRAGRFAEATVPLTRALQAKDSDVVVRSQLAVCLFETKNYVQALKTLEPIKPQVNATPHLAYVNAASLGAVALEQNNLPDAIRNLESAEKLSPDSPNIHEMLAEAYRKSKRDEDADKEQTIHDSLAKNMPPQARSERP